MLMLQDSDQESSSPMSLQLQNKERVYSQKLQLYQEAQQRQAQLVQKLQTKVTTTKEYQNDQDDKQFL